MSPVVAIFRLWHGFEQDIAHARDISGECTLRLQQRVLPSCRRAGRGVHRRDRKCGNTREHQRIDERQ